MRKASYGALNKLALKRFKDGGTFLHQEESPSWLLWTTASLRTGSLFPGQLTGIQEVINEDTVLRQHLLAYACGSDKAVAGDVNHFTTFPDIS